MEEGGGGEAAEAADAVPDIWQSITGTVPRHLAEYHTDFTQTSGRVSQGLDPDIWQSITRTVSDI